MSIYHNIFDLLNTYVFGGTVVDGSYEELVCIFFSTCACLFMVSLPFLVVGYILKMIGR